MHKGFGNAFAALLSATIFILLSSPASAEPPVVETSLGQIRGLTLEEGDAFLGIPYAQPPVGPLRFKPPVNVQPWNKGLDATRFQSRCLQKNFLMTLANSNALIGSEDCLYLNVYRPSGASSATYALPVMVWIHGGAFTVGAGDEYDVSRLAAEQNVIVITINYQLGPLGFLSHPQLSAESPQLGSGNYGILDQQLALRWVQQNIDAFGGDPGNVTIFGESAGGASVCFQLIAPGSAGLFHRAVIQSGLCTYREYDRSLATAEKQGLALAAQVGCAESKDQAQCLRELPASTLGQLSPGLEGTGTETLFWPVHGGGVIPLSESEAFRTGHFNQVPVINGTTLDEGRLFALFSSYFGNVVDSTNYESRLRAEFPEFADEVLQLYPLQKYDSAAMAYAAIQTDSMFACPALRTNRLLKQHVPVFAYEFVDQDAPFILGPNLAIPDAGAYHGAELVYIFQKELFFANASGFTPAQQQLAHDMGDYWTNFARVANPNAVELQPWVDFNSSEAIFLLSPAGYEVSYDFAERHLCSFWLSHQ